MAMIMWSQRDTVFCEGARSGWCLKDAIPIMYPQERDVTRAALMDEWRLDDKVVTRT
jgi:hypothetical protein